MLMMFSEKKENISIFFSHDVMYSISVFQREIYFNIFLQFAKKDSSIS